MPLPALLKRNTKSGKKDVDQDHSNHLAALIPAEDLNVIKYLGEGQYGVVELGEWKTAPGDIKPKYVAIKSIKDTVFEGGLRNVLQEAQTMQKLSHNNIVKFFGISLSSGEEQLKLITEFAPFGSLDENFRNKNKNVSIVSTLCKFASQVANGMNYLANQNLVHRDLATRNVLLFEKDLVKISDFGLARTLEADDAREVSLDTQLAIAWMPPETLGKRVFTSKSDVWSYGIMLWEMFSFGQKPWVEFSTRQIREIVAHDPNKRLDKPYACPDGFYELIMLKSWARDPKDRPTFEDIAKDIIPKLQPKEGTTKVRLEATAQGYLSFESKQKVTIISRIDDGMLLAQTENCCIGLINEKHVKTCASNHAQITAPFEVRKRDSKEIMAELRKIGGEETEERLKDVSFLLKRGKENNDNRLLELAEGEVVLDPNYTFYPDPYPAMTDWKADVATAPATAGQDSNEYATMEPGVELDEDDYEMMDHVYSSLKRVTGEPENTSKQPGLQSSRPGRSVSESEVVERDGHYDLLWRCSTGSRDDGSVQLGRKGNAFGKKVPPPIPARLDKVEENSATLAGEATSDVPEQVTALNPKGTTPKKRPIPTPRRKTLQKSRPTSDGFPVPSASCDDAEGFRRCSSVCETVPETPQITHSVEKVPPEVPLPYKSTTKVTDSISDKADPLTDLNSVSERSEKHAETRYTGGNQIAPDERLAQTSQANLTATSRDTPSLVTHGVSGASAVHSAAYQVVNGQERSSASHNPSTLVELPGPSEFSQQSGSAPHWDKSSVDLIDLSDLRCPPLPPKKHTPQPEKPRYATPLSLPMYPDIPAEVINQPPQRDEDLFGGNSCRAGLHSTETNALPYSVVPLFDRHGDLSAVHQLLGFDNPSTASTVNPVVEPVSASSNLFNRTNPASELLKSRIQPNSVAANFVDPFSRAHNSEGAGDEGSYGEEIDAGIHKIQEVCGKDVSRDWCYAALLQYQGDVEEVVRVIKVQKLANITGKTEEFCKRTLTHCSWDLNRAAEYIMDNFENKGM